MNMDVWICKKSKVMTTQSGKEIKDQHYGDVTDDNGDGKCYMTSYKEFRSQNLGVHCEQHGFLQGISTTQYSSTPWTARFLTRNFNNTIFEYTVNSMVSYKEFRSQNLGVHCEQHGFLQGISTTQYSSTPWTAWFLTRNFGHKILGYIVNSTVSYKEFQSQNLGVHCEQHGFLQGISTTQYSSTPWTARSYKEFRSQNLGGTLWTARFLTRNFNNTIFEYTVNSAVSYKEFQSQNLRVHCEEHGFLQGILIQNLGVHCEQHGFLQGISTTQYSATLWTARFLTRNFDHKILGYIVNSTVSYKEFPPQNLGVHCKEHGFLPGISITKSWGTLWTAWFLTRNFNNTIFGYIVKSTVSYEEFRSQNLGVHCEQHGFLQRILITKSLGTLWTAWFLTRNFNNTIFGYTVNSMVSCKEFRS